MCAVWYNTPQNLVHSYMESVDSHLRRERCMDEWEIRLLNMSLEEMNLIANGEDDEDTAL